MKVAMALMVILAMASFLRANALEPANPNKHSIFSAKFFNVLGGMFSILVIGIMFWKYMNFYTIPRILLLISACTYMRNKKKKRFCTPFWKMFRITLTAYSILGVSGISMEIMKRATNGNYTFSNIIFIFMVSIPITILLLIVINVIFTHLLTRRRTLSYYY